MQKLIRDEYGNIKWLYVLFVINVVGFIVSFFTSIILKDNGALNLTIHNLDKYSIFKIWKIFTYSLADIYVPSLIGNLLWLWIFGSVLSLLKTDQFVFKLYIFASIAIGIIGGIICYFVNDSYLIQLVGFTSALIAITTICVYLAPNYKFPLMLIGDIPIWILGVVFLLLRIFFSPSADALFMMLIYLLAIPIGFLFLYLSEKNVPFNFWKSKPKPKGKLVALKTQQTKPTSTNDEKQLNTILEKISASGIESLSSAEKLFLENYTKKNK